MNTFTTGAQTNPAVAMDAAGNFMTVWSSAAQDGSGGGIFAQRFNSQGTPLGNEFLVNSTTLNDQSNPQVAMDAAGDSVVTWNSALQDGSGEGIFAQRFNSQGIAQGNPFQVNSFTTGDQLSPHVAMDTNGNFVVAWNGNSQFTDSVGSTQAITAQRFNAQGIAQGSPIDVAGSAASSPSLAMGPAGNFAIGWNNAAAGGQFAQLFNADGTIQATGTPASPQTTPFQLSSVAGSPSLALGANGNLMFASTTSDPINGFSISGQRFDSTGTATGNPFSFQAATTVNQGNSVIASDANGNFIVGWQNGANITAQEFNAAGQSEGSAFQVNTDMSDNKTAPAIAFNGTNFVTAWQSANQDGSDAGIFAQVDAGATNLNLTGLSSTTTFNQRGGAIAIGANITVTAPSGDQITGATVQLVNWQPEDRLAFSNSAALQHTFTVDANSHTATLTLSGAASAAAYQQVLRSITFEDVAGNPNTTATRMATFTVNDATTSATATQNIKVVAVLGGLNQDLTYTQGRAAISVMSGLTISIPPTQQVSSATVRFDNWQPEDRLVFFNPSALQHTFTIDSAAHTATLTLSGNASASAYQQDLRSLTYQDVAGNPNTSAIRHATLTLNAGNFTSVGTQTIHVSTSPLSGFGQTQMFVAGSAAISVAPDAVVTLPQGVQATGATLTFKNWMFLEDQLKYDQEPGLQASFTQYPSLGEGILTITGNGSASAYQALLRSITYQDTAQTPNTTTRLGTLVLNYGTSSSATATQDISVTA